MMHIGETAKDGTTAIYGVDNLSRGIAYSRDVARMWAASPDFIAALQYILQLCGTEKESEFHHTLKVDIPEVCEGALRLVESESGENPHEAAGRASRSYLSEVARIIEGATRGDMTKVRNYAGLLIEKLQADGLTFQAQCFQRILDGEAGAQIRPMIGE